MYVNRGGRLTILQEDQWTITDSLPVNLTENSAQQVINIVFNKLIISLITEYFLYSEDLLCLRT